MAKKKASIVDAFIFRQAKQAVDTVTKDPNAEDKAINHPVSHPIDHPINHTANHPVSHTANHTVNQPTERSIGHDHEMSMIISPYEQDYITKRPDHEQVMSRSLSAHEQHKRAINEHDHNMIISRSYHDHITTTSSSLYNNTTTKSISDFFNSDPRSLYWKDKGLTEKQLQAWLDETKMTLEDMITSLEHCWFEMVHLGKEEKKGIRDVLSWFYKTIRKVGFYPPPKGFRSYDEIRAEEMAKARKAREQAIEKLKEEARKDYELKKEQEFWEMMADPESRKYKTCFEKLNKFEKGLKEGPAFEKAMRRVFEVGLWGE